MILLMKMYFFTKIIRYKLSFFAYPRPKSEDAWNFANEGIIQGINIMSSGIELKCTT